MSAFTPRHLPSLIAVALSAAVPSLARAYDEDVHTFLARTALEKAPGLDAAAPPISPDAPAGVRLAIDAWARSSTDAAIRDEWIRRYPTPDKFDAWAEKELLLLEPSANVFGIDRLPEAGKTFLDVIEAGSRQPDDDRRNRDRVAYDAQRAKVNDALGAPVPADPALLNFGKLGALSSQAHAHYGLVDGPLSADPEVLKTDPRRFAVASGYPPGPVLALAGDMAQMHLDLALIAALAEPPSPTLAWLHTGQAFHYLEDVSNQIHTVQVGIYDFFVDATVAQLLLSAKTGGGYLGNLRTMPSIGVDILTNHHVISEKLTRSRVIDELEGRTTPEGARLVAAPRADDEELAKSFERALEPHRDRPHFAPFGRLLTRAMIEASSVEGGPVYAATRAIIEPKYRKEGVLFDEDHDDPRASILPAGDRDERAYGEFFSLQERAFRRAGTAMRRWVQLEQAALSAASDEATRSALRSAAIERLVRRQLKMLGEAESRRKDYLQNPPPAAAGPERMGWMMAVEVGLIGAALFLFVRQRRRRRRRRG